MARRRMIDPNIWGSEDMSKLTIRQRMLVIGLFSNADDYGKGKAKATYIRSIVFPYDDIPIPEIIDDLEAIRATITIHFYEVDGNSYYKFLNWEKWQTVQKPQPSIIPEPVENHSLLSPEQFSPKGKEEKGKEEGKEEKGREEAPAFNLKDSITSLLKECKVQDYTLYSIDVLASYHGVVEFEVIEAAIKKAQDKHVNYAENTLKGWIKEGKTTKGSVIPKPQKVVNHPNRPGKPQKPSMPIYQAPSGKLEGEEKEELARVLKYLEEGA